MRAYKELYLEDAMENLGEAMGVPKWVSGVSLRMIQQYEQGAKDINKATGTNLLALARTLGCRMEDLMEMRVEGEDV